MATYTHAFSRIFELAQQKLRNTFVMELAELLSRVGLDQENNNEEENEARKATETRLVLILSLICKIYRYHLISSLCIASAVGSKTYIFRSSLDPILIEHTAQTEAENFEDESGYQSVLFPYSILMKPTLKMTMTMNVF